MTEQPDWEQLEDWATAGGRLMFFEGDGVPEGQWLMLPGPEGLPPARRRAPAKREHRRAQKRSRRRNRN